MIVTKTAAGLLSLAALAASQFHPVISPELSRGQIADGLVHHMKQTYGTAENWGAGWIYESCKSEAQMRGYNPNDIEIFNVFYEDCNEPWIMCRHRGVSSPTKAEMVERFGKLPLRTRQYIRHVNVFPDLGNGAAGLFYNYNIMFGNNYMDLYVLIHESSHALDYAARADDIGSPFSGTSVWQDAYRSDSRAPTSYARTNWVESYAEIGPLGFYEKHVPGGLINIQPNTHQIRNQLNTYVGYLGWDIEYNLGWCNMRLPNTEPVPMSNSFRVTDMADKPDVGFKSENITVVDFPETPRIVVDRFD
ncbi:hypothetical protein DL770_009251 [Monosporascus sp. CRB-9-2]|nr:hypothetical protein DL770_009251 [Monosporascus sp. CRB-9-2]